MEDIAIKKDQSPYLIFACKKCNQYSYVKTTQKTKKCLRCGRTHQVRDILEAGEEVLGMTEALNTVKRKQNELSIPGFRSGSDFVITSQKVVQTKTKVRKLKIGEPEIDYTNKFNDMIVELSNLYKKFPKYLLEIKAEDYQIPRIELNRLIKSAIKSGILVRNGDNDQYYAIKRNDF